MSEPRELLATASRLLRRADPDTAGLWPRVAALLALQALEASLGQLWRRHDLAFRSGSLPTQLICLRSYLDDGPLAARAGHAWSALRRACHHHPYELAPTAAELETWLATVEELAGTVAAA